MKRFTIALLLAGCQQAPPAADEKSPAIVNGTLDYGDPAVGFGGGGCSATLIGRRTALLAAHCVGNDYQRDEFCNCTPWFTCNTCMGGYDRVYPSFDHRYGTSYDDPNDDVAIIILDGDYTATYGVQPKRIGSTPYEGERIRVVGYGATVDDGTGTGGGYKRQGYNVITDVSDQTFDYDDTSQAYGVLGDSGSPTFVGDTDCEVGVFAAITATEIWPFTFDRDYTPTRLDTKLWWIQPTSGDPSVLACNQTRCGDGFCQSPETCSTCPQDCGACPDPGNPCSGQPDGTDCGDDCCTGFNKCRGGVCTTGTCCNTQACCLL
jgi:V8-like Glu-specific endopeptidase